MLFFGEGRKRDKRTNGQTHTGGWVENVTNGLTDKRTNTHRRVGRKRDERTNGRTHSKNGDTRTASCFLRKNILEYVK